MTGFDKINRRSAGKIPSWQVHRISNQLGERFRNPLDFAYKLKMTIFFNNGKVIYDIADLAEEIAKRCPNINKKTLSLFEKALNITNLFMQDNLKKPLSCKLDLGHLLPAYLIRHDLQGKAEDFLETKDLKTAITKLQKMGIVKIDYEWPIDEITKDKSSGGYDKDDVNKLMGNRFEDLMKKVEARPGEVIIKFNGAPIDKLEDLTLEVARHKLEKNGRILDLFAKVIEFLVLSTDKYVKKFDIYALDLAFLLTANLKKNKFQEKEIDDIIDSLDESIDSLNEGIDSLNESKVIDFLHQVGALHITR